MEKDFLSGLIQIMGGVAVFFSFLPLILYWCKGLAESTAFMLISIFWMINGIIYAPEIFNWEWYVPVDEMITLYYNLFDAPLILLIFYYAFQKRIFLLMILAFFAFEAVVIFITGFNLTSNEIIIAVGSFLCLGLNIWGAWTYFKQVNHTANENAYLFIFAGFIFYYGLCVDLIYIFKLFHFSASQKQYADLINYSAMVLATGLISYSFCKIAQPEFKKLAGYPATANREPSV